MAVRVSDRSYEHAQRLIKDEKYVLDERDDWSGHQPTAKRENEFIEEHGFDEYRKWHLGEDDEEAEDTKARYKFPYGDSRTSIDVVSWPPSRVPASTSISTWRRRPRTCTECWRD